MTPVRMPLVHRKVLSSAMQRIALALLALMSTTLIACSGGQQSGSSLTGPSGLGSSSTDSSAFSGLGDSRLPAIVVNDGISCPSDAPLVLIGSKDARLDIEWSPIPRVQGYQVSIEEFGVTNDWQVVQTLETGAVRAEWTGRQGAIYRARVRSRVCGAFGLWSSYATKGLTEAPRASAPTKPAEPECPTVDGPIGDYRARSIAIDNCPPPCQTNVYAPGSFGGRTSSSANCPPPCQTQVYAPTTAQANPCAPPCEVTYGSAGKKPKPEPEPQPEPEPEPCSPPPCEQSSYPDRVAAKGNRQAPEVPECKATNYPLS